MIIQNGRDNAVLGDQVIDRELLSNILAFQKAIDSFALFKEVGLRVTKAEVVLDERVIVKVSEGWEIYINPSESIDWQITKVELVLDQEIPFEKRPLLEYIDLRSSDKIFYKLRGE